MNPLDHIAREMPAGMTAGNWRAHPFAPWAFSNVARFLPTACVRKGGNVKELAAGNPLAPIRFNDGAGGQTTLPVFLRETHADAFIVVHRGAIVFENYAGATGADTRHLLFSVTKAMVGLLAEHLIAERLIDAHVQSAQIVPELAGTAFGEACLRDLLDMRDGVPFDENYADPDAQIHLYSRHFWGAGVDGVLAALRNMPRTTTVASMPFCYRTPVTDVIGLMVERAMGSTLPELFETRMWRPAGAGDDANWVLDTGGRAIASAGLACTLRDLARLGLLLVDAAKGCGGMSMNAAMAAIRAGGDREAFARSGQSSRPGYSYRSGWWIDHQASAINALGVFGQRLHIAPDDELVIARFGSHPVASNQATDAAHARAFTAIRAALPHG